MTPTQLSKRLLESEGLLVAVVERWNSFARIRQDLFGCFDLLAVGTTAVFVQTTSASNISARRRKLHASPALARVLAAGLTAELHGWRKSKGRWKCNREVLTPAQLCGVVPICTPVAHHELIQPLTEIHHEGDSQ